MSEVDNTLLLERGVITSVNETSIEVLCQSKVDCRRCEEGRGCGGGILARWLGDRQHSLNIIYSSKNFDPQVAQIAEFTLPANMIVKIAGITYGLPLVLLATSFLLTSAMSLSELQNIGLSILVLASGFFIARAIVRKLMQRGHLMPNLQAIFDVSREPSCLIETVGIRLKNET